MSALATICPGDGLRAQTMQTSMRLDEPSQSNLQSFMVLMEAGQ